MYLDGSEIDEGKVRITYHTKVLRNVSETQTDKFCIPIPLSSDPISGLIMLHF